MKKMFLIFTILVLTLITASCNNPESKYSEATVFGLTNRCPVCVTMKVDADGKVLEAKIDEYLSVYDMGKLERKDDDKLYKFKTEILENEGDYARFVRVGEKVFVYDGEKYICEDLPGEDKSFEAYITGEGGRWYVKKIKDGDFDIVNDKGEDYGVSFDEYDGYKLDKKKWADKMENGYMEGKEYDNGWKEGIYNLITHIKNHGFYDYLGNEKPSGDKGTYKVGKYDTLVTFDNFHDYMGLAQKAYSIAASDAKNKIKQ